MQEKFWAFVARRQSTIASGLAALLIIVIGFSVFTYFSRNNRQVALRQSVETTEQGLVPEVKDKTQENKTASESPSRQVEAPKSDSNKAVVANSPKTYTVVRGDNLCQIATRLLGDCNKWVGISQANKLANPRIIHAGNVFVIPGISVGSNDDKAALPKSGQPEGTKDNQASVSGGSLVNLPTDHVVISGDNLWKIAQRYYGQGSAWIQIQKANSEKVGTFANGRLGLIRPGQTLNIPPLSSP